MNLREPPSADPHRIGGAGVAVVLLALLGVHPGIARAGWTTFTRADGLAGSSITSMTVDRSGQLWFGTYDTGVSRYDGARWTSFGTADGLGHDNVLAVFQDRSGAMWFGTQAGASRYDGARWTSFGPVDGLPFGVYSICQDRSGALWFGGGAGGVSRHDGTSWTRYTTADGLASDRVLSILEDGSGAIWFGTNGGVSRFDGVTWTTLNTASGLAGNQVTSMALDGAGHLWFGTNAGVSRYDGTGWTTFTRADGLADDIVLSLMLDRSGVIRAGTARGVSSYDGERWTTFTTADGLPSDYVAAIVQDVSGGLWFGTTGGAGRYDGERWTTFTTADGLAGNYVVSTLQDRSGALWFGSYGAGVSRYAGGVWTTFTTASGLAGATVNAMLEDRSGALWFGTSGGVSRFDGAQWTSYTTSHGLAGPEVTCLLQDRSGVFWFGTNGGVSRFDGAAWTTFTHADGLAANYVTSMLQDATGTLWFGTYGGGVSRFDGVRWTTYTTAAGLAGNDVTSMLQDRSGALWFGTFGDGVTRYDGTHWTTFTAADGLAGPTVVSMWEDRSGALWFGTFGDGVGRFDGDRWTAFAAGDGLAANEVFSILEDDSGTLWFGTFNNRGVSRYTPDRVPPETVLLDPPRGASASRAQSLVAVPAYQDTRNVDFSFSVDGGPWSGWSGAGFLSVPLDFPGDGAFVVRVRCRDRMGNVDPTPAEARFEIDATPPVPILVSPGASQTVRDSITVVGSAADPRFLSYSLAFRALDGDGAGTIASSMTPVAAGTLGGWHTPTVPDGDYELRLTVVDSLGLTGASAVPVVVDNHPPFRESTSPATISPLSGGHVYTADGRVHLYFPPHSFAEWATVSIQRDTVPEGPIGAGAADPFPTGHRIAWGGVELAKPATIEILLPEGAVAGAPGTLALYVSGRDSAWTRVGGTFDAIAGRITSPLRAEGRYRLAREQEAGAGGATLGELRFSPRVFAPGGGFANTHVDIQFDMERPGPATVRIYNRAGRVVRELLSGTALGAGANVVRWDGRDQEGVPVRDGLYIATVEALGRSRSRTLAVVR